MHKKKNVLFPTIGLSLILLLISDTTILKVFEYNKAVPYNCYSNITWADFRGEPQDVKINLRDRIDSADAQINSSFYYKVNNVYSYPQIISISSMNPDKSWTKIENDKLLNHENTHLLIDEFYSRKVNELNKDWPIDIELIHEKISILYDSANVMQKNFDKETFHGTNKNQEQMWEEKMSILLN